MLNSYKMGLFNKPHLMGLGLALIITIMLFVLAKPFDKKKYGKFLGVFIILAKMFDIYLRVFVEKYPPFESLPFHFCNISILLSGIYLITRNKYMFSMIYCWGYGAFLTLLIPTSFVFTTYSYVIFFFLTHSLILATIIYGYKYYNHRVSFKGYILSLILLVIAIINAHFWNVRLGTNFMYLSDYILPIVKFIPFNIYLVLLFVLHVFAITSSYLIGKKLK
ncbi:TMEM164-related integral membrane acyltransferase [Oceanivirga salmonicida]|uniref:TMEM164-related integral membrane acyltransferase n=1 Tax=Oceanivirga salmonicida TaxID=1769291 RepID=UPI00082EA105|nr:TIGR02206 family membrane protein [Oceanivirga salmonicida]